MNTILGNKKPLLYLFFVPFLALSLMGAAVLEDPPAIPVPSGLNIEQVEKGIKIALINRGWLPKDIGESGKMEAILNVRSHTAIVTLIYDTQNIQAFYKDSVNLDYKEDDGVRKIHRNYNKWVNTMLGDIQRQLILAQ